ncbi:tyrosine-type recombinase/integrase [Acidobacteriota bacterium]
MAFLKKGITFERFTEIYLGYSKANKAHSTYWRHDRNNIKKLLTSFQNFRLSDITPMMIETYKAKRRQKVSAATVNRELANLKNMFTMALEWGMAKSNPAKGVKRLKEPPGRIRYLRIEEIEVLVQACANHIKPIVIIAVNTGMRKGEILKLRWDCVDLRNRNVVILNSKNNESRIIPINKTLYNEFERLCGKKRGEYVFANPDGQPYGDIKKGFTGAVRRAGIEDFRFHDLRHTFASYLVMSGVDLRTVQQLLGHKDLKMTMRYSQLSSKHVQESIERLDDLWLKDKK